MTKGHAWISSSWIRCQTNLGLSTKSWRFEESKPGGGGICARQVRGPGPSVSSSRRARLLEQSRIRRRRFCSPLNSCCYGNNGNGKMIICILSGKRLNELSLCYQLEGGLECSVNVEVLLAEKAEALPQLGLPGEEVESPTNPAEGQKSGVK